MYPFPDTSSANADPHSFPFPLDAEGIEDVLEQEIGLVGILMEQEF